MIHYRNENVKKERSNNLLALNDDDKIDIKNSTTIDFDKVLIEQKGTSYGNYIECQLPNDCKKYNYNPVPRKMRYGCLLGQVTFVDEVMNNINKGHTFNEVVTILKNNLQVKKVYIIPNNISSNGGHITRLA